MTSTFQLHVLPLSWPDMGFPYTMPEVLARLAGTDLSQAVLVFDEADFRGYDGERQEIWLTQTTVLGLVRTRTDKLLRAAVGRAFVVTLAGRRLYGGLFYPQGGAAAIRFPVIHVLGEPLTFLRIRPALGNSWTLDTPDLAAQRAAIADSALASWLAKQDLLCSIPDALRPRDPWARQA
jgi:hypothetical protein